MAAKNDADPSVSDSESESSNHTAEPQISAAVSNVSSQEISAPINKMEFSEEKSDSFMPSSGIEATNQSLDSEMEDEDLSSKCSPDGGDLDDETNEPISELDRIEALLNAGGSESPASSKPNFEDSEDENSNPGITNKKVPRTIVSSDEDEDLPDISQVSVKDQIASSLFSNERTETVKPVRLSTPPSSEDEGPGNPVDSDEDILPDIAENDWDQKFNPMSKKSSKKTPSRKQKPRKEKTISEKKRKAQMLEIASKTQAMARERRLALPYHKPEQLTLEEFLKRRSESKTTLLTTLKSTIKPGSTWSSTFKHLALPTPTQQNTNPNLASSVTTSSRYRSLPASIAHSIPKLSAPNAKGEIDFDDDEIEPKKRVRYPPMPRLAPPKSPKKKDSSVGDQDKTEKEGTATPTPEFTLVLSDDEDLQDKKSVRGKEPTPGAKLFKLKKTLQDHIRAKKTKEYEEKLKLHQKYLDEKKEREQRLEGALPDDEEILEEYEEFSTSEEEEEDEELELERLLSGRPKKDKKKTEFVDDEAEDEDGNEDDDDEDEEDSDELEEIEEDQVDSGKAKYAIFNDEEEEEKIGDGSQEDDLLSLHEDSNSNSFIPGAQPTKNPNLPMEEGSQDDSQLGLKSDAQLFPSTPKICSSVLEQKVSRGVVVK